MNTLITLIVLAVVLFHGATATAQIVITSTARGVQLHWSADTLAKRTYLVYRRLATDRSFPTQPLARINSASCADVTTALQQDTLLRSIVRPVVARRGGQRTPEATAQELCDVLQGNVGTQAYQLLVRIARAHYRLAALIGSYHEDRTATLGTTYVYDVRYLDNNGVEVSLSKGRLISIKAGDMQPLPAPAGISAYPTDGAIQIAWTPSVFAAPIMVELWRSTNANDWSNAVVVETIGSRTDTTVNGEILPSTKLSYLDYGTGDGLVNGTSYYYRLRFHAAGDRRSDYAPTISAKPRDTTAPSTPQQLSAAELPLTRAAILRWNRSFYDMAGRPETMGEYHVYRMPTTVESVSDAQRIAIVRHTDVDTAQNMMVYVDRTAPYDSCRDVSVAYRVVAVDAAGNTSYASAPFVIVLRDDVPPQKVKSITSQSTSSEINIVWPANTDCAVMRYNIYRAYCDYGTWLPCPDETHEQEITSYIDVKSKQGGRGQRQRRQTDVQAATCGGPFALIGSVEHKDGVQTLSFTDRTIPRQSPLCYAYIVSAVDSSGNQSVRLPIPDPVLDQVICANLIDVIPPHPAAINNLSLGDQRITVVASTPSQQDLAGFYVYRTADSTQPFQFIKAMYYDGQSGTYVPSDERLTRQDNPVSCDVIPLGTIGPYMQCSYVDEDVIDRTVYYYKVTTVDRNGNQSPLDSTGDIATFTYGRRVQSVLRINSVLPSTNGGNLEIDVDVQQQLKPVIGFALYRSTTEDGEYLQVGQTETFEPLPDYSARRGRPYWYRVMVIYADHTYSDLTPPVQGILP